MDRRGSDRFLVAAEGNHRYPVFLAAILTGMRQGELLGLRWTDLDLDAGVATVRQTLEKAGKTPRFGTPKTKNGRRSVVLPELLVAALRKWKAAQNEEKLLLGGEYRDYGLVFPVTGGGPIFARSLTERDFARLIKASGVLFIRFHEMWRSSVVLIRGSRVHMVVSARLGHSTIAFTLHTHSPRTSESDLQRGSGSFPSQRPALVLAGDIATKDGPGTSD